MTIANPLHKPYRAWFVPSRNEVLALTGQPGDNWWIEVLNASTGISARSLPLFDPHRSLVSPDVQAAYVEATVRLYVHDGLRLRIYRGSDLAEVDCIADLQGTVPYLLAATHVGNHDLLLQQGSRGYLVWRF